jgi:signal transduction histidine kinase
MAEALEKSRNALDAQTAARLDALEQLRHADRLKTVGTLASGVAHELGTPLNVVSGRAQTIVAGEVTASHEVVEAARVIRLQADRMARIVRQLLDFARLRRNEQKPSELGRITRDAVAMLEPLARKHKVELALAGEAGPLVATVDPAALGQAVTNIVMNALQATPEGGRVEIRLAHTQAAPPGSSGPPRACGCIDVQDPGPGIPPDQLPQIFDPFFTTKEVGQGTGLGLSVAHGIVAEHGGWIEVQSELGAGSRFRLWLPLDMPA